MRKKRKMSKVRQVRKMRKGTIKSPTFGWGRSWCGGECSSVPETHTDSPACTGQQTVSQFSLKGCDLLKKHYKKVLILFGNQ